MEKNRNLVLVVVLCLGLAAASACLLLMSIGAILWDVNYKAEQRVGQAQPSLNARMEALERQVAELEARLDQLQRPEEVTPVPSTGGARVIEIVPGSPAAQSGLLVGDIITAVDRQPVGVEPSLSQVLSNYRPGDRAVLAVTREGRSLSVEVVLAENPENPGRAFLGVRVDPVAVPLP